MGWATAGEPHLPALDEHVHAQSRRFYRSPLLLRGHPFAPGTGHYELWESLCAFGQPTPVVHVFSPRTIRPETILSGFASLLRNRTTAQRGEDRAGLVSRTNFASSCFDSPAKTSAWATRFGSWSRIPNPPVASHAALSDAGYAISFIASRRSSKDPPIFRGDPGVSNVANPLGDATETSRIARSVTKR